MELGRLEPYDPWEHPRLVLDRYVDTSVLGRAPAIVDRASKVPSWPMYGNDTLPDCTFAACGHEIQSWTAYGTTEVTLPDGVVEAAFRATGPADQGRVVQDVLGYWRKTGIGGHKIAGFAQITSIDNLAMAKQCLNIFGTIYLGIEVPQSAIDQFNAGRPWDWTGDTNIVGGHAVPVQYWGSNQHGEIEVVTWGKQQRMTRAFWWNYVQEAWVVFSHDSLTSKGLSPIGLDITGLRSDFTALTGLPAAF